MHGVMYHHISHASPPCDFMQYISCVIISRVVGERNANSHVVGERNANIQVVGERNANSQARNHDRLCLAFISVQFTNVYIVRAPA